MTPEVLSELSVIIPCLNEAENLPPLMERLEGVIVSAGLSAEVLILDDASGDKTWQVATQMQQQYRDLKVRAIRRYEPRRGYGAVVRYGLAHAHGSYCVLVSADSVDPIELLPQFVEHMRAGAVLVQCSRYLNPGDAATIPFKYKFYQAIYRTLIQLLLGHNIRDSTYAFKMFDRVYILALGLTSNRFSISPEITFKVLLSGGNIVYVPAGQGVRQRGASKFVFWREGYGYSTTLLRAWLHRLGVLWF